MSRAGAWSGGGFIPRRIDRDAVRARLTDVPTWIVDELLDAFEPAAMEAAAASEKRRAKTKVGSAER